MWSTASALGPGHVGRAARPHASGPRSACVGGASRSQARGRTRWAGTLLWPRTASLAGIRTSDGRMFIPQRGSVPFAVRSPPIFRRRRSPCSWRRFALWQIVGVGEILRGGRFAWARAGQGGRSKCKGRRIAGITGTAAAWDPKTRRRHYAPRAAYAVSSKAGPRRRRSAADASQVSRMAIAASHGDGDVRRWCADFRAATVRRTPSVPAAARSIGLTGRHHRGRPPGTVNHGPGTLTTTRSAASLLRLPLVPRACQA
jgi:hypothetical protein